MKRIFLLLLLLITTYTSQAQIRPFIDDYYHSPVLSNPSLLARNNYTSINLTVYQRWGVLQSPVRNSLSFSTKFKKSGIAMAVLSDINGALINNGLGISYFYDATLTAKKHLAFSISGYGMSEFINLNGMENVDETAANLTNRYYPQIGAGILYYTPKLNIGLSAANMLKSTDFIVRDSATNPTLYTLDISYNYSHPIELYFFQPRLVFMYSQDYSMLEGSFYFYLLKMLKIGAALGNKSYEYSGSYDYLSILMGIKIKNKFFFNYRFDYSFDDFMPGQMRIHNSISLIYNIYKETDQMPRFF